MKINLKQLLQLFVSVFLIGFLIYHIDWELVKKSLINANYYFLLLSFILIVFNRIIMAIKWNMLLRVKGIVISWFEIVRIYYISTFLGLVLPATVGADLIRVFYVSKKDYSKADVLASIVVERVIGFIALFIFGLFGIIAFLILISNASLDMHRIFYSILASVIIGSGLFILSFNTFFHNKLFYFLGKFKNIRFIGKIIPALQNLMKSYEGFGEHKNILFGFFLLTLLEISTVILWGYTTALSLNVNIELTYFAAFIPIVLVLIRLPISLDGFGINEGAYVYFLGLVGISKSIAFSVGFINHIVTIIGVLPGGIFYALSDLKFNQKNKPYI